MRITCPGRSQVRPSDAFLRVFQDPLDVRAEDIQAGGADQPHVPDAVEAFGHGLHVKSYLYAVILTLIFSLSVNFFSYFYIRKT